MHPRNKKIKRKSSQSNLHISNKPSEDSDINTIRFPLPKQSKTKEMSDHKENFIQNDIDTSNSAIKQNEEQQDRPQYLSENSIEKLDMDSVSLVTKPQWQAILNGILSEDNETLRLQCLMELCNHLVVLTEDHLNGFKADQFIPPLVSILQTSQDPNLMLFVCRAFSHLLEALPTSVGYLIRNGAIPALCEKLLTIEYIDLAEQVINALLKISEIQNGGIEILKSGGLTALLTYLDFFSIDIQYKAIQASANILSIIPNDCFDIIRGSIDQFNQLLDNQDTKILSYTCICVYKIIKALSSSKKDLNNIRDMGITTKLINILSIHSGNTDNNDVSIIDYTLRALTIMVNRDGTMIHTYFKNNLPSTLHLLLENEKKRHTRQNIKHAQTLYYIICLIDEMLPNAGKEITIQPRYYYFEKVDKEENTVKIQEYEKNREYIQIMVQQLLRNLVELYGVRSSVSLNQKCLSSIYKMIAFSSDTILREELKDLSLSSFIVRLLGLKDAYPVMIALHIGESLMEKLPSIFKIYFVREGVINEINQLIETYKIDETIIENDDEQSEDENLKRKRMIYLKATEFKSKYFSEEKLQTEELKMFNNIAEQIKEINTSSSDEKTKENVMKNLRSCLSQGISTYELIKSGLIESLLDFLTFNDKTVDIYERKRIRKLHSSIFQNIFLTDEGKDAFTMLLNECQHVVDKLDNFEADTISVYDNPIGCLKYLTRQFALKLVPHEDETISKENILVHAEPLATIKDVKSYLKKKLSTKSQEEKEQQQLEELMEEESSEKNTEEGEGMGEEDEEHMSEELEEEESGEHNYDYLEEIEEEGEFIEEDEEEGEEEDYEDYNNIEEEEDVVDLSEIEKFKQKEIEETSKDKEPSTQKEVKSIEDISEKPIKLFFKGIELDDNFNIFKAVYIMNKQSEKGKSGELRGIYRYWTNKYEIDYLHVDEQECSDKGKITNDFLIDTDHFFFDLIDEVVEELQNIENRTTLNDVLYLIKIMYTNVIQSRPFDASLTSFINDQLTTKIIKITQDPLLLTTGVLPDWIFDLMSRHQHLFTLDVRTHYFRSTSLGISRTFLALKERLEDFMRLRLGRIYRQKVRIHRNKILESAFVIFKKISSSSILEIEYFDEVATGLGPTLEFFTLLSHEFQSRDLNLWVDQSSYNNVTEEGKSLCYHPYGLFPRPSLQNEFKEDDNMKKLLYFNFGCFIAKAIADQRLIDVHISNALIRFLLGEPLTIYSLREIFPEICQVIEDFNEIVIEKKRIINDNQFTDEEKKTRINNLTYKNVNIEDLSLYFVLPGYDIPLIENGEEILVTIDNIEEYVDRMIQMITKESIEIQMNEIKEGFNTIFDSNRLRIFTPQEINTMIYGSSEMDQEWDKETILNNTICDHGYTQNSRAIKFIVEIMSEFTVEERRKFLRFITGSPRLPPGGFKGLSPKLTFVRKEEEPPFKPDDYLPSVNTCFLYLKLPDYSSKEIMKKNLFKAIEYGQSGFSLS